MQFYICRIVVIISLLIHLHGDTHIMNISGETSNTLYS